MKYVRAIFAAATLGGAVVVVACSGDSGTTTPTVDSGTDASTNPCGPGTTQCSSKCVDTALDPQNCGSCANACPSGQVCSGGKCGLTCVGGTTKCGDKCADTQVDHGNCGTCGNACGAGQVCSAGTCASTCGSGLVQCGANCVDPKTSLGFCGATAGCGVDAGSAGTVCTSGQQCINGTCATSCLPNQVLCGGKCVDPQTDNSYCGATAGCGDADAGSPGTACGNGKVCSGGVCSATCASPLSKCTPDAGISYCANTQSDPTNCGACGTNCPARPNSVTTCAAGSCSFSCNAGRADCNVNPSDGCEATLATDGNNCGKCGNVCPGGKACFAGKCGARCANLTTNAAIWGQAGNGIDVQAYTNGTLDWIGCNGNGCAANTFFCTDEQNGIFFGTTSGGALRMLVDPGNAGGSTYPSSNTGCSAANNPRGISNGFVTDNDLVNGLNPADVLCKALGYTTGVVVTTGSGNVCPRPHAVAADGSNWNSTWNGNSGVYGAQYRCSSP